MNQLVTAGGIVMFSTAAVNPTLVKPTDPAYSTDNTVKIAVKRLVAKVAVEKAASLTANVKGVIDDLTFAVNNRNKKMYLVPKADGSDPNYTGYLATDFFDAISTPATPATDEYIAVNASGLAANALTALYAPENTSDLHQKRQITRATVRGTFVPDSVWQDDGASSIERILNPNKASGTPVSFWSVVASGYVYYTLTLADATAVQTELGGTISDEYIGGHCYWDVFLNPRGVVGTTATSGKEFDVFRNDFYRCTINKILALGRPGPDVTDPLLPPSVTTDLDVEVNVVFWNLVSDNYELVP